MSDATVQGQYQNPVATVRVNEEGVAQDPKSAAVRWLFGQEASTVLLFMIVGGGAYMTWWHVTIGAPASIQRSTEAFQKSVAENNAAHKEIAERHAAVTEKAAIQTAAALEKLAAQNAASVDKLQGAIERMVDKFDARRVPSKD